MAQSLASFFSDIADAIRIKKNTTKTIKASDFVDEILSIGGNSSYIYDKNSKDLRVLLANIAEAIRIKRGITGKIPAKNFVEEILKIETGNIPGEINYSAILGKAILGYAILGNNQLDVNYDRLAQPEIFLLDTNQEFSIYVNFKNITVSEDLPDSIKYTDTVTLTLSTASEDENAALPDSIQVSGAAHTWDKTTGKLTIYEAFTDVIIQATGIIAKLDTPSIRLSVEGAQLQPPTLSLDKDTGILTINDIDPDCDVVDIYIKGKNDTAFTLKYNYLVNRPTTITLSYYDQVYAIASNLTGTFADSDPSSILSYNFGQLALPSIYLQLDDMLDAPAVRFTDEANFDYKLIITAVANANRYEIYEYLASDAGHELTYTVESTLEAGSDIITNFEPQPGAFCYIIAKDTTGTYNSSMASNELARPYGKLETPEIQLQNRGIDTPSMYLDGNTPAIIGVANADTYIIEVRDSITGDITTHTESVTIIAGEEYKAKVTLISSQFARVYAADSNGIYDTSLPSPWVRYFEALPAPIIIVDGQTGVLAISGSEHASHYEVYSNGSTSYTTFIPDVTNLVLEHLDTIKVIAKDNTGRYLPSDPVEYEYVSSKDRLPKPDITFYSTDVKFNLTAVNVELVGDLPDNATTDKTVDTDRLDTVVLTFTANDGYTLPTTLTVEGAEFAWAPAAGTLTLSKLTNTVSISITGTEIVYPKLDQPNDVWLAHTVTWLGADDSVIQENILRHGDIPAFTAVTPSKASTAQYTYTFAGWDPAMAACTESITYKPIFTETINKYTVTWKNWNGDVLETDTDVPYDTTPIYNAAEPTRSDSTGQVYTFAGWDKIVTAVTGNVTYTATFKVKLATPSIELYDDTPIYYTVIFKYPIDATLPSNLQNTVYYETQVLKGSNITLPEDPNIPATDQYTWTFNGWDNSNLTNIQSDQMFTAQFTRTTNKYKVRWNVDGSITEQQYEYGATPSYPNGTPEIPSDEQYDYEFTGWEPAISEVTGDITYEAWFRSIIKKYTITWKNWDGTTLATSEAAWGTLPTYTEATPSRAATAQYSYTHLGWTPALSLVSGSATYVATFTETLRTYSITFNNYDGTQLAVQSFKYGETPVYTGTTPTKAATAQYSYTHSGWTPAITAVTGSTTYTATFTSTVNKYTITWKNYNNDVLETDTGVAYGATPSYDGATPSRPTTVQSTYTFKGWDPSVTSVTGDAAYTATFTPTARSYTITWKNYDGSTLQSESYNYGVTPTYKGTTPTKPSIVGYDYTFKGWSPSIAAVTGAATYTAEFEAVANTTGLYGLFDEGGSQLFTWEQLMNYGLDLETDHLYTSNTGTMANFLDTVGLQNHSGLALFIPPDSISRIGTNAFGQLSQIQLIDCRATLIENNESLAIGDGAFAECTGLESIIFTSVASIGTEAFVGCSKLNQLSLPENDSLKWIGNYAFKDCTSLKEITLPANLDGFGNGILTNTTLNTVKLNYTISSWINLVTNINNNDLGNGYLLQGLGASSSPSVYMKLGALEVLDDYEMLEGIEIPSDITELPPNVFANFPVAGVITNDVQYIGAKAFYNCSNLTQLIVDSDVLVISSEAFAYCTALEELSFTGSGTSMLADDAFSNCSSLQNVLLSGISSIGTSAFSNCTSLKYVVINNNTSAVSIQDFAFKDCTALTDVDLSENISRIGTYAFNGCASLSNINLNYLTALATIEEGAFCGCYSLTEVTIPSCVEEIEDGAFAECNNISVLTFEDGNLTTIGMGAFQSCISLVEVSIPSTVTTIKADAFASCIGLETFNVRGTESSALSSMGKGVLADTNVKSITLPFIGASPDVTSDNKSWLGYIFGGSDYSEAADVFPELIDTVNISGSSYIVAASAFYGAHISNITLGSGCTDIELQALANIVDLQYLTIPFWNVSRFAHIGQFFGSSDYEGSTPVHMELEVNAIAYIPSTLGSITICASQGRSTIPMYAFSNMDTLHTIVFEYGITEIGAAAFFGCSNLKDVQFPDSLTTIEPLAFDTCYSIEYITIPASVTYIGGSFIEYSSISMVDFNDPHDWYLNGSVSNPIDSSYLEDAATAASWIYENATQSALVKIANVNQLNKPNLSRVGDTMQIEKVSNASAYDIYVDGVYVKTVS